MTSRASNGYGRLAAICFCGVAVRITLGLLGMQQRLESTPELVVPSASWERAKEGLFLASLGLSHYAGGVFAGSPLLLGVASLCAMLPTGLQNLGAAVLFAAFDVASALLLRLICLRAVAVESCDWETELEKWMDEDTRPPGRNDASSPESANKSAAENTVPTTEKSRETQGKEQTGKLPSSESRKHDCSASRTRVVDVTSTEQGQTDSWHQQLPDVVVAMYLLNPLLVAQCVALSGDVLGRVLPLTALAVAGRQQFGFSPMTPVVAAALAAATCLWRFHAAPLLLPVTLMLSRGRSSTKEGVAGTATVGARARGGNEVCDKPSGRIRHCLEGNGKAKSDGGYEPLQDESESTGNVDASGVGGTPTSLEAYLGGSSFDPLRVDFDIEVFARLCTMFVAFCVVILGACWLTTSPSWGFLRAAVGGQLLCEDLTPNAGLYWYFFAEIFPRFRGFFLVLFLSQPYVYVLPVVLRLGMFPEAAATLLLAIFGFFQPYPTLADPMLAGCLFLCHPRTARRMRIIVPVFLAAAVPSLLLPTMRHLWLRAGTGNANFYYFQTVVLNVLLSVLVLQFAAALVKRRKAIRLAVHKQRNAAAVGGAIDCSGGD